MKKVLIFIIILMVVYFAMFNVTKSSLNYITMLFYTISLLSSLSNLFIRYG